MAKLVLYGIDLSPPVRACKLTLKALDIPYEYKEVDLLAGEQNTPEFMKKNPQHTVPVLEDNGHFITDSHAICAYLVDKYAKTDELYPKDLLKRARVNASLFYDGSMIFMTMRSVSLLVFLNQGTVVDKEKVDNIRKIYDTLELVLAESPYVAGDHCTIADLSCAPLVTPMNGIVPIDAEKCPHVLAWLSRMSKISYFDEINAPFQDYVNLLKAKLTEIQL